jgi:hypothetical protein
VLCEKKKVITTFAIEGQKQDWVCFFARAKGPDANGDDDECGLKRSETLVEFADIGERSR